MPRRTSDLSGKYAISQVVICLCCYRPARIRQFGSSYGKDVIYLEFLKPKIFTRNHGGFATKYIHEVVPAYMSFNGWSDASVL